MSVITQQVQMFFFVFCFYFFEYYIMMYFILCVFKRYKLILHLYKASTIRIEFANRLNYLFKIYKTAHNQRIETFH